MECKTSVRIASNLTGMRRGPCACVGWVAFLDAAPGSPAAGSAPFEPSARIAWQNRGGRVRPAPHHKPGARAGGSHSAGAGRARRAAAGSIRARRGSHHLLPLVAAVIGNGLRAGAVLAAACALGDLCWGFGGGGRGGTRGNARRARPAAPAISLRNTRVGDGSRDCQGMRVHLAEF
jgi:hypothetical protein